MDSFGIQLRPQERVLASRQAVRVHYQVAGTSTSHKIKCDLLLTSLRLVGRRQSVVGKQTAPDIDRVRLEITEPDTTVTLLLPPQTASE